MFVLRYILSCHWPIWSIARHPPDQLSATYYQSGSGKTGLQRSPGHTTKQPATPLCRVLNWWGGRGVLSRSLIDCLSPPGRFLKCVRWVLLSITTRPWSTVGVRVINVLRLTAIFNIEVYMFDKKRQLQQWTNIINKQYLIHFTRCKNILNQF